MGDCWGEGEFDSAIWYLYVVGIVAWYWARIAKRIAVGPAGR